MARRRVLTMLALALVVIDALFLVWRWHRDTADNAMIVFVGLDSLGIVVPASEPAITLEKGQWRVEGHATSDLKDYLHRTREYGQVSLVALSPNPTYGHFIQAVRDLKARHICNIAVREQGEALDAAEHRGYLGISAFVLCGNAIGDAGFIGVLPLDRSVHVSWDKPAAGSPSQTIANSAPTP